MSERGVRIDYGDFAPGAKEAFVPTSDDAASFVDLGQLQEYNLNVPNYANPCEQYLVPLDDSMELFPDDPEDENMGFWSEAVTDANGDFAEAVTLTLTAQEQYSSQGFTFTFDTFNGIFATALEITWYRGETQLETKTFNPDSAFYFCEKSVENFDKVEITFASLNMPNNRLRIRSIDFGHGTSFRGSELRSVKVVQEISPISAEISINTADIDIVSRSDVEYSFQARQPLSIYYNGDLVQMVFVRTSTRKAKREWSLQCEDYIGMMDDQEFRGGMYVQSPPEGETRKNAKELLQDIFTAAKVPCDIQDIGDEETISGYLPICSCREALMMIAFRLRAVVDTSGRADVRVYRISDGEVAQSVPLRRIRQGQKFTDASTVTAVELYVHSYTESQESVQVFSAKESGTGNDIYVPFSEPLHDLERNNESYGTIEENGTNYAIINVTDSRFVLSGKRYEHMVKVISRENSIKLASDRENVASVQANTMITADNDTNTVLNHIYDYLIHPDEVHMQIIDGVESETGGEPVTYGGSQYGTVKYGGLTKKTVVYDPPVQVGKLVACETEYLGVITGRLIRASFSLMGGIVVKEAVVR